MSSTRSGRIWSTALAVAFGFGLQIVAAEADIDGSENVPSHASPVRDDIHWESLRRDEEVFATSLPARAFRLDRFPRESIGITGHATDLQLAQFQLPKSDAGSDAPVSELPKNLDYEYGYGTESEIVYHKNPNLNSSVQDNQLLLVPELNGYVIYRPNNWMEATLEMIFQWEIPVREVKNITLPNGDIQSADSRRVSLLVDQAFVTFKNFADPLHLTIGRRNFEDDRHWLYDTSLDVALVTFRGVFRVDASVGREALLDLDGIKRQVPDQINTWTLYGEYRGIEHIKLAGYAILRDDRSQKGRSWFLGVRSLGNPTENLSYWADVAFLHGSDESGRVFSNARGFDIGGTYRFAGLPLNPSVTLGFAYGSGDGNPDSKKNSEFRQTGLQSNETKFGGIPEFKIYGEAFDPELSNLKIFTLGLGFRPAHDISVDLVYHRYRLDKIAEELRDSGITALMNQNEAQLSKDVGSEFDVVVGIRNVFGLRRLGVDLRMGWFFPGRAYSIDQGGDRFRKPDKSVAAVMKLWW